LHTPDSLSLFKQPQGAKLLLASNKFQLQTLQGF
ncbi:MAG: hypothetical protein RI973_1710, partial [Bacteroidota bacterium]